MKPDNCTELAMDIYKMCMTEGVWGDCIIYTNGKAITDYSMWSGEKGVKIADNLYEYANRNPLDYCEYANPDTLTMTFEGHLYEILNAYYAEWSGFEEKLSNLFEKYGYYYEMGYAWSISAYKL